MAAKQEKLYRTRTRILGGICGGIARYFGIDADVVRLFTVILAILTCGALVFAYVALWAVLPLEPVSAAPVDVAPESIASEMYSQVVRGSASSSRQPVEPLVTSAHMPPPPPPDMQKGPAAPASYAVPSAQPASTFVGPSVPSAATAPAPVSGAYPSRSAQWGLAAGIALVTIGAAALISNWVHVFSVFQFWPLLLVAAGVARLVIPGRNGYQAGSLALGVLLFAVGSLLLMSTLGVAVFRLDDWFGSTWPLLVIAAGVFILGRVFKSSMLLLLGTALVIAFCAIGLVLYSDPGPAQSVWVPLPFDQGVTFGFRG